MHQDEFEIDNPNAQPPLLDPSDLSVLRDVSQTPLEVSSVPAEISAKLIDFSLIRRVLGSYAITGKGQLALARRLYSYSTASLLSKARLDAQACSNANRHTVGESITIEGNIVGNGEVEVSGEVKGNIYCKYLLIGPTGRVSGDVVAKEVIVQGYVNGSVRAEQLSLLPSCYVEGELHHGTLNISQGAYFEGISRRCLEPISIPPSGVAPSREKDARIDGATSDPKRPAARRAA